MAENKTKETSQSVSKFINSIKNDKQKQDSKKLVKIFEEATKKKAKMWGKSIIGFDKYKYKTKTREGEWMKTGFSPRIGKISLYIMSGFDNHKESLKKLGIHKISGGCCLYIKTIDDIKIPVLKKIIKDSVKNIKFC